MVTVKYRSGHSEYCVCGFLLIDVLAVGGISKVRFCDMEDIRLWQIANFKYWKVIFEVCRLFSSDV